MAMTLSGLMQTTNLKVRWDQPGGAVTLGPGEELSAIETPPVRGHFHEPLTWEGNCLYCGQRYAVEDRCCHFCGGPLAAARPLTKEQAARVEAFMGRNPAESVAPYQAWLTANIAQALHASQLMSKDQVYESFGLTNWRV